MLKHPPHPSEFSVLSHILKKGFFKFSLHLFSLPIPFLSSCICSLSACHTIVTASLPPRCFFVEITTRGALKATFANIRLPLSLYSDPSIPILHFRAGFDICRRGAAGSRSHQHQPSTCLGLHQNIHAVGEKYGKTELLSAKINWNVFSEKSGLL